MGKKSPGTSDRCLQGSVLPQFLRALWRFLPGAGSPLEDEPQRFGHWTGVKGPLCRMFCCGSCNKGPDTLCGMYYCGWYNYLIFHVGNFMEDVVTSEKNTNSQPLRPDGPPQ